MQLDDIGKRENLSTEEVIQIASTMSIYERLHCSVPITPVMRLEVYLNNKAEDHGYIATALVVHNRPHMRRPLFLRIHHTNIQRLGVEGRDWGNGYLSVNDIVIIFELGGSARWQILGVYDREESVEKPDWM